MKILFSPQRNDEKIDYIFEGQKVIATYKDVTDTFDFTNMPDGKLTTVSTTLEINPIISAEKIDGELSLVLLNFHGQDAAYEELFPEWQVIE